MELIADISQLSLSELYEFAIAFIEYTEIGCNSVIEDDIVEAHFGGENIGWRALEIIKYQSREVLAYFPIGTCEIKYIRTRGDAVYVLATITGTINEHINCSRLVTHT